MSEQNPDFFIVGAPKCGTTAMNGYLRQHPQIFMPPVKDTTFFGQDLQFRQPRISREAYLSLFESADGATRIGETSVWYLYSRVAAEEIKRFSPAASIIIMLRNPVDMLYAQHSQFLYNRNEDIVDFEAALDAEEERKQGKRIPTLAHLVEGLFYRETVKYSEQVERYFDVFGREQVHVIIFDDFKRDTSVIYRETLAFLGVETSFCPEFRIINSNKALRSRRLQAFLIAPPPFLTAMARVITPHPLRGRLSVWLRRFNRRYVDRPPLDPALRKRLQAEFRSEVERLSQLLGRDLNSWST